jgi:hypothetical protein
MFLPGPIHGAGLLGQGLVEFLKLAFELIKELPQAPLCISPQRRGEIQRGLAFNLTP